MIRSESEYQEASKRLEEDKKVFQAQKQALIDMGLTDEQLKKAMEPVITFNKQLEDEIKWYDSVRSGEPLTLHEITDLGKGLIALRIASGMSQKELAKALNVSDAQVSRDERNDYHGITKERAQKIVEAIRGAELEIKVTFEPPKELERVPALLK